MALGLKTDIARTPTAWLYLIIALAWGLAMALIIPPFQVADEGAHCSGRDRWLNWNSWPRLTWW